MEKPLLEAASSFCEWGPFEPDGKAFSNKEVVSNAKPESQYLRPVSHKIVATVAQTPNRPDVRSLMAPQTLAAAEYPT